MARLADAQLGAAICDDQKEFRQQLALEHYINPRPLWWEFDWGAAKAQAESVQKRFFDDEAI